MTWFRKVKDIGTGEAADLLQGGGAVLIDVRTGPEWAAGHARAARHHPLTTLDPAVFDASAVIIAVCRSGSRSSMAARRLRKAGLDVRSLRGEMHAWARAGLPVVDGRGTSGTII